jgi:hypothetical protein
MNADLITRRLQWVFAQNEFFSPFTAFDPLPFPVTVSSIKSSLTYRRRAMLSPLYSRPPRSPSCPCHCHASSLGRRHALATALQATSATALSSPVPCRPLSRPCQCHASSLDRCHVSAAVMRAALAAICEDRISRIPLIMQEIQILLQTHVLEVAQAG